MHLHDLLGWPGPMTGRQFEAWQAWLADGGNEPDLHAWYLMQVAAEIRLIRHSFGEDPKPVKLSDLKLKFVRDSEATQSPEEDPVHVEAVFLARMGLVGKAREEAVARGQGKAPAGSPVKAAGKGRPLILPPQGRGAKAPTPDARTWEELDARRRARRGE